MRPLVSVIVPVYNVEKYLEVCLNSILEQTYTNLEILVVDDGATDSSPIICDRFAELDARIKVTHQTNKGLSGARNTAMDIAQGEYFMCVDSDDFIERNCVERLLDALEFANADLAVGGYVYCDEKGERHEKKTVSQKKEISGAEQMKNLLTNQEIGDMAWCKLYKKELFDGIRYPLGKYHEDVFTTYKLLARSKKTVILPEALYNYRQVQGSIMNSHFTPKHLDGIVGKLERAKFVEANYEEYREDAYASVVYTCCKCFERMIKADYFDEQTEKYIQTLIRNSVIALCRRGIYSSKTKLFACCSAISMKLTRRIYHLIG